MGAEAMYNNGHRSEDPVRVPLFFFHEFIRVDMGVKPFDLKTPDIDLYLNHIGVVEESFDIEDFLADLFGKPRGAADRRLIAKKPQIRTFKKELIRNCEDMLQKDRDELARTLRPTASFSNLGRTAPPVDRWNVSQSANPPRSQRLARALSADPW